MQGNEKDVSKDSVVSGDEWKNGMRRSEGGVAKSNTWKTKTTGAATVMKQTILHRRRLVALAVFYS